MQGRELLDIVCSSSTVLGLSDKSSDDTVWRNTVLGWANLVKNDISNRQQTFHWRWLEKTSTTATVADQHSYDLPGDIDTSKIFAIYERTNDVTYQFIPYQKFVNLVANPSNDIGDPARWFTLWATTLRLYPVPSSVITIFLDYIKTITDIADDGVAIEIPEKYNTVLIDGILTYIYRFDPQLGDQSFQSQLYENGLAKMIKDNNQMIAENTMPTSHRERFLRRFEVNGRNSTFFPLGRQNI